MKFLQLGLALLIAAGCVAGGERRRVQTGKLAPDFTLESKDGDLVTLSDYRGKKNVVLVFYRGYW